MFAPIRVSNVVTYLLSSQSGSFRKILGLSFLFRIHTCCRVNWDACPLQFLLLPFPSLPAPNNCNLNNKVLQVQISQRI